MYLAGSKKSQYRQSSWLVIGVVSLQERKVLEMKRSVPLFKSTIVRLKCGV